VSRDEATWILDSRRRRGGAARRHARNGNGKDGGVVWKNEKGSDQTVANAAGEFSFPAIEGRALLGFLPHEPVIKQIMTIEYQGKSYDAWAYYKHDYGHNDENNGRPINLTCRLEAERAAHGEVSGICEFN